MRILGPSLQYVDVVLGLEKSLHNITLVDIYAQYWPPFATVKDLSHS